MALEGWDPFNVTEDCDLGVRLFKRGYQTAIIDSVTLEEATSQVKNWLRQRSRWIKGYMQTYLVHMRSPRRFVRENGIHAFIFQLIVGGKVAFMVFNPFLWITTIVYFSLRSVFGPLIESLFPPAIFYISVFSLLGGNFLYLYYYMIGCARRGHWDLIKYVFLIPFYWVLVSASAAIAAYQLLVKPHYWEKTKHGRHLLPRTDSAKDVIARKFSAVRLPRLSPDFIRFSQVRRLRRFMTKEAVFVAGMFLSNALNFLFHAYLGRVLSFENLGLVAFINTIWYLAMIMLNSLSTTVNAKTAELSQRAGAQSAYAFQRTTAKKGLLWALGFSLLWLLASPWLGIFFQIKAVNILFLSTPIFSFGLLFSIYRGYLQGEFKFVQAALVYVVESVSKLVLAFGLVSSGQFDLVYLSVPGSITAAALMGYFFSRQSKPALPQSLPPAESYVFPRAFYAAALMTNVSSLVFLSIDMVLVKHFLAAAEAGRYALITLAGKMIFFLASVPSLFLISFVGKNESRGLDSSAFYKKTYSLTVILATLGVLAFGFFGRFFLPLLLGEKARSIIADLPLYSLAIGVFSLSSVITTYHLAKKHYHFSFVSLAASLLMAIGIMVWHGSISEVIQVIASVSLGLWLSLEAMHVLGDQSRYAARAFRDFADLFRRRYQPWPESAGKKILVFNWRDPRHVFAGGAEMYIHEIAKRWAEKGAAVTLFCGNDGRSQREEIIDNVKVIRRGGFYMVYFWAFAYYLCHFRGQYDVIVDCQNGIPFFTPLYAKERVYCLMHHVHQEVFRRSLSKPLAALAMFLEKRAMPLVYKNIQFVTVSESSRREMAELGLGEAGIEVINPGVDGKEFFPGEKSSVPLVAYLGRLKAYKSIHHLLAAFQKVLLAVPEARLVIAGSGEEEAALKKTSAGLGLGDKVEFSGFVDDREKVSLLQRAWVAVNPSFMEGWGITTIEANACATPVVASDVPGLRDSIRNPHTGYLVEYGNVESLAEKITAFLRDRGLREAMSRNALDWSREFDWAKSSERFFSLFDFEPKPKSQLRNFLLLKYGK